MSKGEPGHASVGKFLALTPVTNLIASHVVLITLSWTFLEVRSGHSLVNKYPLYVFCELIFSHLAMCPGLIVGTLQPNALKQNKR